MIRFAFLALSAVATGCQSPDAIETLLEEHPERFGDLLENADEALLKIELSIVHERPGSAPTLERHSYSRGASYFYPASTIKTCAAIAALRRLRQLESEFGVELSLDTPLRFQPLFDGESVEESDPSHLAGGTITLGHDIRKVFLVSDNAAYNRLYEFAGHEFINATLREAGLDSARILHRLSEFRSPEDQLHTPRVELLGVNGDVLAFVPERRSAFEETNAGMDGIHLGDGYTSGDELVAGPMSFEHKNYMSPRDLQDLHVMLLRPEVRIPGRVGFDLHDADREFIRQVLAETPGASNDPVYDPEHYGDDDSKFLAQGVWRVVPRDEAVIRDKVGRAYGFSTTNSEVTDSRSGRSYFLTATVYLNPNQVLNDGVYGYDRADQFFIDLGEVVSRFVFGDR